MNKAGYDQLEAGDLYHLSEHETAILFDALTFVAVADDLKLLDWKRATLREFMVLKGCIERSAGIALIVGDETVR
jgi:hypothetical protein